MANSRRRFLGTLAVLSTVSTTGCNHIPIDNSTGLPTYSDWAYSEELVNRKPKNHSYTIRYQNYNAIRNHIHEYNQDFRRFLDEVLRDLVLLGNNRSGLESIIEINSNTIYNTNWSKDSMNQTISEYDNISKVGAYNGYDLYISDGKQIGVGIMDGKGIVGKPSNLIKNPIEMVKILIDTNIGDEPRLYKENDDVYTILREVGDGDFIWGKNFQPWPETNLTTGVIKGTVGKSLKYNISNDNITGTWLILFKNSATTNMEVVKRFINERYPHWSDTDFSKEGRVVTAVNKNIQPADI